MDYLKYFSIRSSSDFTSEFVLIGNGVLADLDHALELKDWIRLKVIFHGFYRLYAHFYAIITARHNQAEYRFSTPSTHSIIANTNPYVLADENLNRL